MSEWYTRSGRIDRLPIDDRGLQYGDGLFETVAIRQGRPRLWQRHIERLERGCSRLQLPCPDGAETEALLQAALDATAIDTERCTLKLLLTAGPGGRGYARPASPSPVLYAGVFHARDYPASASVRTLRTMLAAPSPTAGLKTLNRLEQVLGRRELGDAFEGLMCDGDNRIICGTMSNVFIGIGNRLMTPALDRCGVAGVVRAELLERAAADGRRIDVVDVAAGVLLECDSMLLTNSQFGTMPVASVNGRRLPGNDTMDALAGLLVEAGFGKGSA